MTKDSQPNKRQLDCKYFFPGFDKNICVKNSKTIGDLDDAPEITKEYCEKCKNYKYRYIEYPIIVNKIEIEKRDIFDNNDVGRFVKIRPCNKKYGDKTYLGLYLGRQPAYNSVSFNDKSGVLQVKPVNNPAIYVFELQQIVFGMESWWSFLKTPEEIEDISDLDINNTWYVQILKAMTTEKESGD